MNTSLKRALIAVLLIASGFAEIAFSQDFWERSVPDGKVMPGMQTQWVGQDIRYNGVRAGLRTFTVSASSLEVVRWYETNWKASSGAVRKQRSHDGSIMVATEDRGYFYSIQVAQSADGGSEGSLAVSVSPRNAKVSRDTEFPVMPSAAVLSRVESFDPGQRAETLIIAVAAGQHAASQWYRNELAAQGWRGGTPARGNASIDQHGEFLQFTKGSQRCDVAMMPAEPATRAETVLVVNCLG